MTPYYNSGEHDDFEEEEHEEEEYEEEEELRAADEELEEAEEELKAASQEFEEFEEELEDEAYKAFKYAKAKRMVPPRPPRPPRPPTAPLPPLPPMPPRVHRRARRHQKSVTIRGIDSSVYDDFSTKMKQLQLNLGTAVTKLMQDVLKDPRDEFPTLSAKSLSVLKLARANIEHHPQITVSKQDLIEANAGFSFSHIEELTFDSSVDRQTFNIYVRYIEHCKVVRIPSILPKLLIYSKINHCKHIEVYEVKSNNTSTDTD
ncbi:MAG: hypothetical protein ACFFDT_30020 [Candidatus Hodarchaeota archaeon]